MAVASNEFDSLLEDLRVVQQVRDAGDLRKALTPDGVRQAISKAKPAPRGPFFTELRPSARPARPAPRQTSRAEARAKAGEAAQSIMAKAMSLFGEGKITATQVSELEARVHRLQASAR